MASAGIKLRANILALKVRDCLARGSAPAYQPQSRAWRMCLTKMDKAVSLPAY